MRRIIYLVLKKCIAAALYCYYKKIKFYGQGNMPKDKPILFLSNHQNGLMDPLIIAALGDRKPYFLTRSDVFANSMVNAFFDLLRMLPIYRIRDGKDSLAKNQAIFDRCVGLLKNKEAILMFPEANHNIERRVRPLSKGFTRILFKALKETPRLDIRMVPVGINYIDAAGFPDSTTFYFGEDIKVQDLYDASDLRASTARIKEIISDRLKQLTIHIADEENYDAVVQQLNNLGVDYLQPQKVNSLLTHLPLTNTKKKTKENTSLIFRIWDGIFIFLNLPVLLLWRLAVKPKVPEVEFTSTYRFLFSVLFFPIYYILLSVLTASTWRMDTALIVVAAIFVFNLFHVKLR